MWHRLSGSGSTGFRVPGSRLRVFRDFGFRPSVRMAPHIPHRGCRGVARSPTNNLPVRSCLQTSCMRSRRTGGARTITAKSRPEYWGGLGIRVFKVFF